MRKHYSILLSLLLMFQPIDIYASKWDIYSREGRLILENFEADGIYYIDESRIIARRNESILIHTGYNYSDYRVIENISVSPNAIFYSNRMSVYDSKTLKYGFIDENGQIVIPMVFDYVETFVGDYTVFGCGDTSGPPPYSLTYGLMNNSGKILRECRYNEIKILGGSSNPIYITKKGLQQSIVRRDGGRGRIIHISDQFQTVLSGINTLDLIIYASDDRYGYIDYNGNVVLKPIFKRIISSSYNKILFANEKSEWFIFDISAGDINDAGNAVGFLSNGRTLIVSENKQGVLGNDSEVLVKPIYDSIFSIGDNIYIVKDLSGYGLLSSPPSSLISKNYESFHSNADSEYFALERR